MTRKQRALKLAKRREAQKRHHGTRAETHGKDVIQVPRGPRRNPKSFHTSDPYRHGEQLRRAEQLVSFCASIGFDPTPEQAEMLRDLFNNGQLTEDYVRRMAQIDLDRSLYGFDAVDAATGKRVDPADLAGMEHAKKFKRAELR